MTNVSHAEILLRGINRALSDARSPYIDCATIRGLWHGHLDDCVALLKTWESLKLAKILNDPRYASDSDLCVEMYAYVNRDSPIPGFLSWKPKQSDH